MKLTVQQARWALSVAACIAQNATAANGAQLTANGPSSAGAGGASIAWPQDSTAAADNPAGMSEIGSRADIFAAIINVRSRASFGSPTNVQDSSVTVPAPGAGFNMPFGPRSTFGVSVTGAGLAADYGGPAAPVPGAGPAKTSLVVVNVAPTLTYKLNDQLALGGSVILGVQQFRANGVIVPGPGGAPIALQSHGNSWAHGVSASVGALWQPLTAVRLGASYFAKTRFSKLSGYGDDLFAAGGGRLNSPARYGVGISVRPVEDLTLALDWLRIEWGKAQGYNEPNSFAWHDQNVVRVGAGYRVNERWTLRAGYMHADLHLDSDHTLANFYANGINNRAVTIGATYALGSSGTIVAAFEHEIPRTLRGTGVSTGTDISTKFRVLTLGYSFSF